MPQGAKGELDLVGYDGETIAFVEITNAHGSRDTKTPSARNCAALGNFLAAIALNGYTIRSAGSAVTYLCIDAIAVQFSNCLSCSAELFRMFPGL
jgi:Holliday junction resolvase-like predicted endonuclease